MRGHSWGPRELRHKRAKPRGGGTLHMMSGRACGEAGCYTWWVEEQGSGIDVVASIKSRDKARSSRPSGHHMWKTWAWGLMRKAWHVTHYMFFGLSRKPMEGGFPSLGLITWVELGATWVRNGFPVLASKPRWSLVRCGWGVHGWLKLNGGGHISTSRGLRQDEVKIRPAVPVSIRFIYSGLGSFYPYEGMYLKYVIGVEMFIAWRFYI